MFLRLLNCAEFDRFDLSSLRICTVGGQSMPVAKMEETERAFRLPAHRAMGHDRIGRTGNYPPVQRAKASRLDWRAPAVDRDPSDGFGLAGQ